MGTVGNPVTDLSVVGGVLTVFFADGTSKELPVQASTGTGTTGNGIDQTARQAATDASNAIVAHEGTPHNTDTTARANATAALDAITAHETNHPSGLPTGSSQRRELKWNANTSAWDAVSDVTTVYYGATAMGDYVHVAAALAAGLNTAGTRIATTEYMLYKGFGANVLRNDHLAALWAAISNAPVVFVLAPAHTDWINNFKT